MMFTRTRTPTIMDGVVIRWRLDGRWHDGEISASRNGVVICGRWPTLSDPEAIATVKEVLDDAHRTHLALRTAYGTGGLYGGSLYQDPGQCEHAVEDGRRCVFTGGHSGEHRLGLVEADRG